MFDIYYRLFLDLIYGSTEEQTSAFLTIVLFYYFAISLCLIIKFFSSEE